MECMKRKSEVIEGYERRKEQGKEKKKEGDQQGAKKVVFSCLVGDTAFDHCGISFACRLNPDRSTQECCPPRKSEAVCFFCFLLICFSVFIVAWRNPL